MGLMLLWITRATALGLLLSAAAMTVLSWVSSSNHSQSRQLRFLDPDHRTCGNDRLAHLFAVHYLYGAKSTEEGYYMRRTISTLQEIPEDKEKINHILRVLSYISRKLDRPIRVNKARISGYNSEHKQGYSLVHAANLKSVGVDVVELNYWTRAVVAQKTLKTARNVTLSENSNVTLSENSLINILSNLSDEEDIHELLFDIDQIAAIDSDAVGNLTGTEGGYQDGAWMTHFACFGDHPNPKAIPPANDPLSE